MLLKQLALTYLPDRLLKAVRSVHYRNSLRTYNVDAEPDLLGCRALIEPGQTVLDIGANIGVYTRFCSEFVGPTGRVFSLEPVPETFGYLQHNVEALGLTNVTCFNTGASDHDSKSELMSVPEYAGGGANLYESRLTPDGNVPVKVARLDTLFPDLSPDFIKCDVEGHELACVRGALGLIARCRPKWMIEVTHTETVPLMESLGYQALVFVAGDFRPYQGGAPGPNVVGPNLFFVPGLDPPRL